MVNMNELSKLFKQAHELTRLIKQAGDSYSATFGLVVKFFYRLSQSERYAAIRQAKNAKNNAHAKAEAESLGLPELSGTPKQVAWATTIRQNFLAAIDAQDLSAFKKSALKASFWIDNRATSREELAQKAFLKNAEIKYPTSYRRQFLGGQAVWA